MSRECPVGNHPVEHLLDALEASGLILEEDVAWIAVTIEELRCIPAIMFICPIRRVACVKYRGVEFRVSPWAKLGHQLYPVWNISKRTKDIMVNKPNCEYTKFKEVIK